MKTYTITIEATSADDAVLALDEVRKAVAQGYTSAPWNTAGDDSGNGYEFTSTGEFEDGGR